MASHQAVDDLGKAQKASGLNEPVFLSIVAFLFTAFMIFKCWEDRKEAIMHRRRGLNQEALAFESEKAEFLKVNIPQSWCSFSLRSCTNIDTYVVATSCVSGAMARKSVRTTVTKARNTTTTMRR